MTDIDYAQLVKPDELPAHYRQVEAFQAERVRSIKRISKVLSAITVVALLGNLAQGWTIASMMPLARIVPVYLWIRPDGTVDDSVALSRLPPTQSKAVTNAALWEYIRMREGYSQDTAQYGYDVVSAFSSPRVRDQYQRFFNYPNVESPQVIVGKRGTITVTHISSSDIAEGIQQIRFSRVLRMDSRDPVSTTWTATIRYTTVSTMPAARRLVDPGGVLVTSYQASEDSP